MEKMWFLASLVCVIILEPAASSNILGIFPMRLPKHYVIFDALMTGLAERGHNVTVYHPFPRLDHPPNYTVVSLTECFWTEFAHNFPSPANIVNCKPLQRLRELRSTFDLLITETYHCDFFALFGLVLKVPVILVSPVAPYPWMCEFSGLPCNPSYIPVTKMNGTKEFSNELFVSRMENTFWYYTTRLKYYFVCERRYNLVPAFFPRGTPTIEEAARNASLWFINTHYSINGARPLVPNVVEVGGMGIGPVKKLPKDLEKFMNGSSEGVVYLSMGDVFPFKKFPEEARNEFLRAFSRIPQRVLVKWEDHYPLARQTSDLQIRKTLPQRDILAHRKVKLFITDGDLNGINQAVNERVPILAIPATTEQRVNIRNIEKNGAGELLEMTELTEDKIFEKILRVIYDKRIKKNTIELSRRYKKRLASPLQTAIFWTEYVIRNRGAPHLKADVVWVSWDECLCLKQMPYLLALFSISFFLIKNQCSKPWFIRLVARVLQSVLILLSFVELMVFICVLIIWSIVMGTTWLVQEFELFIRNRL